MQICAFSFEYNNPRASRRAVGTQFQTVGSGWTGGAYARKCWKEAGGLIKAKAKAIIMKIENLKRKVYKYTNCLYSVNILFVTFMKHTNDI